MKKFLLITENYVVSLFTRKLSKDYLFHNLSHTQQKVNSLKELIIGEKINEVEANVLLFAIWFHDLGYVHRKENHIEASVNIATTFLEEYNIDNTIIDDVVRLIRATKPESEANDFLENIMKDVVSSFYADTSFIDKNELLKQELKLLFNTDYYELEWIQKNIKIFVKEHWFYTKYAQENWQKGKDKNLAKLIKIEKKLLKRKTKEKNIDVPLANYNSIALKGSILFSVNVLVVFLSLLGYYFSNINFDNQSAILPLIIFSAFNAVSSVLSAIVILPKMNSSKTLNIGFLNQKNHFLSKTLKYSYLVLVIGILVSVITLFYLIS